MSQSVAVLRHIFCKYRTCLFINFVTFASGFNQTPPITNSKQYTI